VLPHIDFPFFASLRGHICHATCASGTCIHQIRLVVWKPRDLWSLHILCELDKQVASSKLHAIQQGNASDYYSISTKHGPWKILRFADWSVIEIQASRISFDVSDYTMLDCYDLKYSEHKISDPICCRLSNSQYLDPKLYLAARLFGGLEVYSWDERWDTYKTRIF